MEGPVPALVSILSSIGPSFLSCPQSVLVRKSPHALMFRGCSRWSSPTPLPRWFRKFFMVTISLPSCSMNQGRRLSRSSFGISMHPWFLRMSPSVLCSTTRTGFLVHWLFTWHYTGRPLAADFGFRKVPCWVDFF